MKREDLAPLLHVTSAVAVMIAAFLTRPASSAEGLWMKSLGWGIFVLGMGLFAYAVLHLRSAFVGNVLPVTDKLVTTGPYRLVRHPLYLAMIISILGLTIGLRSAWGALLLLVAFVPSAVYRAKLEERLLAEKFGEAWQHYAERTYFMFPPLY